MGISTTRRGFLALVPAGLLGAEKKTATKKKTLAPLNRGEFFRFPDPVTETSVVRLTNPTHTSLLPEPFNRFVSSREAFLLFASDRSGTLAPFRVNLRTGALTQLADTKSLLPRSLCLDPQEKHLFLVEEGVLQEIDLHNLHHRTIAEEISAFHVAAQNGALVVRRGDRLELIHQNAVQPIADGVASRGLVRPSGDACVFSRQETPEEQEFWYVEFGAKPLLLAKGPIFCPAWAPGGRTVLFLRSVERPRYTAIELREVALDGSGERLIAQTTQYAAFAPNGDGSVFVGASRSKAQPDIMLLLRAAKRETTLCEHQAHNAEMVCPAFSPNSKRVYFESDREGKSSLYSVNVELLVEPTDDD